jgi:hypothetical protein
VIGEIKLGDRIEARFPREGGGFDVRRGTALSLEPAPRKSQLITVLWDGDDHISGIYADAFDVRALSLLEILAEAAK